jgi:hypothetical protein
MMRAHANGTGTKVTTASEPAARGAVPSPVYDALRDAGGTPEAIAPPPLFGADFSAVRLSAPVRPQPKLNVGAPGDQYEREADRVADRVMRMPEPTVQRECKCGTGPGGECEVCKSDPVPRAITKRAQRSAEGAGSVREAPPVVEDVLNTPGQPLDATTRAFFEPRFSRDLSGVRVHTDSQAADSAAAIDARAYTVGSHIAFAPGHFETNTLGGRHLLAHELAHILQQTGGTARAPGAGPEVGSAPDGVSDGAQTDIEPTRAGDGPGTVRTKPNEKAKPGLVLRSLTIYIDMNLVVMGLSDGTSRSAKYTSEGKPNPGTYRVKLDSTGSELTVLGEAKFGPQVVWTLPGDVVIDATREYLIVVTSGTPGQGGTGKQGGAGQAGQPPSQAPGQQGGGGQGGQPPSQAPGQQGGTPSQTPGTGPKGGQSVAPPKDPAAAAAALKALPEAIKTIMGGESTFKPEDSDKLLRIAAKLQKLSPSDLELYKLLATKSTMDLDTLEKSIDVFLEVKERLREQVAAADEQKKKEQGQEPSLESQIEQTYAGVDDAKFATLNRDQKEALARQIANEQTKIQLKHMVTHPGETAAGMVEGVVRPDKVGAEVIDDIKEAADGNKSGFARAAGVFGALGKTAGWIAAVLGVIYVALLFVPGVNLVELGLTALVVGAVALVSTAAEADLRIQAAAEAKDTGEFKTQTQKAAAAQASVVVQAALIALHVAAKLIAKIPIGGQMKTVGGALKAARGKLLTVTGVGPAVEGIRADLLGALKKAKVGLREALARESKPLADTAARVRTMTGREFLQAVADGDPALQEASGLTPDAAASALEAAKVPATSNLPEQIRGQLLKGLEDAPVEAQKQVDSFIKDVDDSVAAVENAKTPAELDAAAAVAEKVLSPEEAAAKAVAAREGYVKGRIEDELAPDRPVEKGKPVPPKAAPADTAGAPAKTGEPKAPAQPGAAEKGEGAKTPAKGEPADSGKKPAMEAVEREDLPQLKSERAAVQAELDQARAELEEVSKRRADLDRTASEAQATIEKLEADRARAKTPGEKAGLDKQIAEARRQRNAATTARKDVPTDREMAPVRNKIERLKGRLQQLDTVLDPKKTRAPLPCFAAGTPVWTPAGPRAIETLQAGDRVLAYDLERQAVVERVATGVHRNRTLHFYELGIGGESVRATGRHPFWAEDTADWVAAGALVPGTLLKGRDGRPVVVESVALHEGGEHDSFNLTVEGVHNYFVGPGVLVHNGQPVDLGLGGDEFIYIGTNKKFPGKVYVGKSDHLSRAGEHRSEARTKLKDPNLTPEQREFYEFKAEMDIEPVVTGIGGDVTPYLEQKNLQLEIDNRGDENVMYLRRERVPAKMDALKERIAKDPKVQEKGYCPKT